jgi:hypothetical protein
VLGPGVIWKQLLLRLVAALGSAPGMKGIVHCPLKVEQHMQSKPASSKRTKMILKRRMNLFYKQ